VATTRVHRVRRASWSACVLASCLLPRTVCHAATMRSRVCSGGLGLFTYAFESTPASLITKALQSDRYGTITAAQPGTRGSASAASRCKDCS
jgi:hypothetical protein